MASKSLKDLFFDYCYISWNFILIYLLAIKYLLKEFFSKHKMPTDLMDVRKRVCIITGGSRGIGLETVRRLYKLNMTVIIAGRFSPNLDEFNQDKNVNEEEIGKVIFIHLDLSNFNSIRDFVESFKSLKLPLHLLINNAGVMFINEKRTLEGYEHQWTINYLGHFYLCHLLLPIMQKSSINEMPSRIVNISSSAHFVGKINFDDIHFEKCFSSEAAYCQSKLALVMFTKTLSEKLKSNRSSILVNCLHPGVVKSDLFENVLWYRLFPWLAKPFLKTIQQGSDTVIYVALSSKIVRSGGYYENCSLENSSKESFDVEKRIKLWKLSCEQLDIKTDKYC